MTQDNVILGNNSIVLQFLFLPVISQCIYVDSNSHENDNATGRWSALMFGKRVDPDAPVFLVVATLTVKHMQTSCGYCASSAIIALYL